MDINTKPKKRMIIRNKTRVKVAGLISDLHLLQSLPGTCHAVAKNYKIGCQFMKYLKEIEYIISEDATVIYHNPKNHHADHVLEYVMTRYQAEYGASESNLVTCEVELPASMKAVANKVIEDNQIKLMQETLMMQSTLMRGLEKEISEKNQIIEELTKKKSIFARIKNLLK